MKRAVLWAALACVIIINSSEPVIVWFIFVGGSLIKLKKHRWLFILLSLFSFVDLRGIEWLPHSSDSRIVELNDSSFVVSTQAGKILVYTKSINRYNILDEVSISSFSAFEISPTTYGFNQRSYFKSNDLIGYSEDTLITNHVSRGLFEFLSSGGFNKDPNFIKLSRAVLFQSDPLTDFMSLVSLGLLYVMILKFGQFILSFFMNDLASSITMLILFSGAAFWLAYPLSLVRVIVSLILALLFKNSKDRLFGYILFFVFYNTSALRSVAILYPLVFMVFGAFKVDRINRWSSLGIFQIALMHQFSLIIVMLYPFLRKAMMVLVALIWIGMFFPVMNHIIFNVQQLLELIIEAIKNLIVIRGSMTVGVVATLILLFLMSRVWGRQLKWMTIMVVFLIPILSSPLAYQMTFLSVGQGDAILLQAPFNQEVILIDTGKPNAYGQLSAYLNAQGISKITTLIITHDDSDHNGNRDQLMAEYRIMRSVLTPQDLDSNWFHLKALKTSLSVPNDNQSSLVYMLQLNELRFLLMADADEVNEIDLLRQYPDLKTDILKVGHHGSATSTSDEFLSHIQARLALISVGYNGYGHPSWLTLERLARQRIPVMTTRDHGDITFIFANGWSGLQTSLFKLKPLSLGF